MTRSIVIPSFGPPEVLEQRDLPQPEIGPGKVRIQVEAIGINFADLLMRQGLYPEAPPPPFVAGYEVAGTILEVADESLSSELAWLKPGARVMAVTRFGGYAEEVITPAAKCIPLPNDWSYEQGAAFPIAFVTAWLGLVPMARVGAGDTVLIHGVAGGVGLAAVQIALAANATVAGTCSKHKIAAMEAHGVDLALDYDDPNLLAALKQWAPAGPSMILEPRGGQGLKESLELVQPTGSVVVYGFREIIEKKEIAPEKAEFYTGRLLWFNPLSLIQRSIGIHMLNIMNLWDDESFFLRAAKVLQQGIAAGHYHSVVDRVFPFAEIAEAHRYMHDRKNIGKVVLRLP